MYFPDLTPCTYFPIEDPDKLLAVGWLDSSHDIPNGSIGVPFVERLVQLLYDPWQPGLFMGLAECEFCRFSGGPQSFCLSGQNNSVQIGVNNLFVPGDGCLFVAPSLVVHYIDAHQYCPPLVFQQAVMACPEMRSIAYLKAILANGPKGITRPGKTMTEM
jgi:hypothetical protein